MMWKKADRENNYPSFSQVYAPGGPFPKWSDAIVAAGFESRTGVYERSGVRGLKQRTLRGLLFVQERRGGRVTPDMLAWRLGLEPSAGFQMLGILCRRGLVERVARGDYRLTEAGEQCDLSHLKEGKNG
jgi:hypothetical protein